MQWAGHAIHAQVAWRQSKERQRRSNRARTRTGTRSTLSISGRAAAQLRPNERQLLNSLHICPSRLIWHRQGRYASTGKKQSKKPQASRESRNSISRYFEWDFKKQNEPISFVIRHFCSNSATAGGLALPFQRNSELSSPLSPIRDKN